MKKLIWGIRDKRVFVALSVLLLAFICGCDAYEKQLPDEGSVEESNSEENNGITEGESAEDGKIDFEALAVINPDIYGWMYISKGAVDAPILQRAEDDRYYLSHDRNGDEGNGGEIFTEFPDRKDFCGFNEVIYGIDGDFLRSYKNPDFFDENRQIDVYIDGDHLTYEVVMSRKWPKEDLLTQYAFTVDYDCQNFLQDTLDSVALSDNVDPRYKNLTYLNFLITLVADEPEDPENQYIVIAMLVNTENGTIRYPEGDIPWVTE